MRIGLALIAAAIVAGGCGGRDDLRGPNAPQSSGSSVAATKKKEAVAIVRNRRGHCYVMIGMTPEGKPVFREIRCPGGWDTQSNRHWAGTICDIDSLPVGTLVLDPLPSQHTSYEVYPYGTWQGETVHRIVRNF